MRAVQAYFNIKQRGLCAYKNEPDILVWKLSILRNKQLGFRTVLYTSLRDVRYLNFYKLLSMYDEVNYIDIPSVDCCQFWAVAKFVAIEKEIEKGEEFFVMDTDLVFMDDTIKEKLQTCRNLFWNGGEPAKNYPSLSVLSRPKGFKYPYYFSPLTRPFNTAIIKIDDKEILKEWVDVAMRFMIDNKVDTSHIIQKNFGYMVTVEQRFLPNILINKFHEEPEFFCNKYISNFGKEHFHIWGAKDPINKIRSVRRAWLKGLLIMLQNISQEEYDYVMTHHGETIQDVLDNWDVIEVAEKLKQYIIK